MKAIDLKKKYLDFFVKKDHKILPNVSLLPENDPTALFINSGMHPLVPYLLGEPHPLGKRLVSNQRCLRTQDIEKIGNPSHLTFFEMLGNWSLGDYWKKEAISWSWEFLTKELQLDSQRISVSCFAGDKDSPKDEESAKIWESLGIPSERIYFLGRKDNWWSVGETGPCGPDTEMFYDTDKKVCGPNCRPGCNCGKYFEIWNDVFMEFNRLPNGKLEKLKQRNIDTGMGVERTSAMLQGKDDVYQTELFTGLINQIEEISKEKYEKENQKAMRIIADHLRAATFAIADGVMPFKTEAGYVVRRLIRGAVFYSRELGIKETFVVKIAGKIIDEYKNEYPSLDNKRDLILDQLKIEEEKFSKARGSKEKERIIEQISKLRGNPKPMEIFEKEIAPRYKAQWGKLFDRSYISTASGVAGTIAFDQKSTHGTPTSTTLDISGQYIENFDEKKAQKALEKAQELHKIVSKQSLEKKFDGGLADHSKQVTKLHTVTHLLHESLRRILREQVHQVGSNITSERLRFDFTYSEKLTPEQVKEVEDLVNEQIAKDLAVKMEMMSLEKAKKQGSLAFFADKYGDQIKVYSIGNFSKEVCGGPHVGSLGEIGGVKIIKEEGVGAGRRRIYAQIVKK